MTRDYFPLVKGAVREYEREDSRGTRRFKIQVLEVAPKGAAVTARCRRTESGKTEDYAVTKDAKGVREGARIEFKAPVQAGTEWVISPRRYWIEALDAETETPAGAFKDCLKVCYLIAEGDGGSGERLYAPGIGLVKAVENDEGEPFTDRLVKAAG